MSNPIWAAILGGLRKIVVDLENAITQGAHKLWDIITQVFTAVELQLMADIKSDLQQIAINLQNEKPGLEASQFIPALVAAAIPVLIQEGRVLKQTAIFKVASIVAHELGVPDVQGNAGNIVGGNTSDASNSAPVNPSLQG